jgi:hypothetical protein
MILKIQRVGQGMESLSECVWFQNQVECWREGIYKESQKGKQEAITKRGNNGEPNLLLEGAWGRLLPFN